MAAELTFPAQNIVGESLIWDDRENRLLWVDIVGKSIHALDPETGAHQVWPTPDFVTSIGLRKDGGAIVGFTKSICFWGFGEGFEPFVEVEPDMPNNRLNEGVVGPDGAFWVGTMQNNVAPDGSPMDMTADTGRLYRCTPSGEVIPISEDLFGITNTLVWTDDGRLITADTSKNEIYSYAIEPGTGQLSGKRTVVADVDTGLPDGSTSDAEGGVWNCRVVGGHALLRFDSDGGNRELHALPCAWPTSCAFGGVNLDTLFVTSARFTMSAAHLDANPQEGALFAIKPGVRGIPTNRFG